jgi:CRISPR-associated protein Cmr2
MAKQLQQSEHQPFQSEQLNKKQILILTLGPVQQFIMQARKTRDLWYGSHLLVDLSKEAAKSLHMQGVSLIFPYVDFSLPPNPEDQKAVEDYNDKWKPIKVANRIVGIVSNGDPKHMALEARRAVSRAWKAKADRVKTEIKDYINTSMWDRQIKDFLEFYAVWTTITGDQYAEALMRADQLMAARKTLRDFKQNEPGALYGDKKSKLDGGRECVFYLDKIQYLYKYGIKPKETLDAVSMVKRLSNKLEEDKPDESPSIVQRNNDAYFPSVCDIAYLPFLKRVKENGFEAKLESYYKTIQRKYPSLKLKGNKIENFESALFYENRLEEFLRERWTPTGSLSEDRLQEFVEDISRTLTDQLQDVVQQIGPLPQYYAFIVCDGDNMGKTLRNLASAEAHRQFSKHLSRFAQQAEEIVAKFDGRLVYSGGDDVMAYVPLTTCLQVCHALNEAFAATMEEALPRQAQSGNGDAGTVKPTLSIGMAIVHMLERLEVACEYARKAEKHAKVHRNRLAIHFRKRHGGTMMTVSLPLVAGETVEGDPFENVRLDATACPMRQMHRLEQLYARGTFSAKLAYELRELYLEYKRLTGQPEWQDGDVDLPALLSSEVERICRQKKSEQADEALLQEWLGWVRKQLQPDNSRSETSLRQSLEQLRTLAEKMIIAVSLVSEGGQYEPTTGQTDSDSAD